METDVCSFERRGRNEVWHCGVKKSWSIPILLGSSTQAYANGPRNQNEEEQ